MDRDVLSRYAVFRSAYRQKRPLWTIPGNTTEVRAGIWQLKQYGGFFAIQRKQHQTSSSRRRGTILQDQTLRIRRPIRRSHGRAPLPEPPLHADSIGCPDVDGGVSGTRGIISHLSSIAGPHGTHTACGIYCQPDAAAGSNLLNPDVGFSGAAIDQSVGETFAIGRKSRGDYPPWLKFWLKFPSGLPSGLNSATDRELEAFPVW